MPVATLGYTPYLTLARLVDQRLVIQRSLKGETYMGKYSISTYYVLVFFSLDGIKEVH